MLSNFTSKLDHVSEVRKIEMGPNFALLKVYIILFRLPFSRYDFFVIESKFLHLGSTSKITHRHLKSILEIEFLISKEKPKNGDFLHK